MHNEKSSIQTIQLSKALKGQCFEVRGFTSGIAKSKQRLEAIGMTPAATLCVLQAKGNGTLIVRLRSSKWAIGKELSEHIEVTPLTNAEYQRMANERL